MKLISCVDWMELAKDTVHRQVFVLVGLNFHYQYVSLVLAVLFGETE
jgi:hypothetical protein